MKKCGYAQIYRFREKRAHYRPRYGTRLSYRILRDKPLHRLSDAEFDYVVRQILQAKPCER